MNPTETLASLEKVFSGIHVMVAYLDTSFDFIWVNRAYAQADGHSPEDLVGKNHFTLYPNDENEAIFRRVVATGESFSILEKPFRYANHPERDVTYWDWALEPVKADHGSVEGLVLLLTDVTEKVKARQRLADAAVYTRGLLEANPDAFIATDVLGRITEVNVAAETLFGYPRAASLGTHFAKFCKDVHQAMDGFRQVLEQGSVHDFPLDVVAGDGRVIPTRINATVHRSAQGELLGVIASAHDMTEQLRAESERRRLYEELLLNVTELRRNEALMARAERLAGIGYWHLNLLNHSVTWSAQTFWLFGLEPHTGPASPFQQFARSEDVRVLEHAQQAVLTGGGIYDVEFRIVRTDGEERFMHAQGQLERDPTGRPIRIFGVISDVTEKRRQEWMLRERFRLMAEVVNDAVWVSAPRLTEFLYVNPAYERIWGRPRDRLYADAGSLTEAIHPDDRQRVLANITGHESGGWDMEYRIRRPDGTERWIHDRGFPLLDGRGAVTLMVGVASDITELKQAEIALQQSVASLEKANQELESLSFHDPLTGVKNRRFLEEHVRREWRREQRHGHELSLIMVDVDLFKSYNDVYGHPRGDECLRQVAQGLASEIHRPSDVVARVGGEEFAVLLPETRLKSAERLAERLRHAVAALRIPHERSSVAPVVTVSLGVASLDPRQGEFQALMELADRALYRAKETGRNRVEVWQ
jgi:diguanylate cyclase (GGDEF)-like protein/PAS domain S-box-containing protein